MDRAKIEEILAQTDFVRSLARSLVLDENSADDISQQALLAALEAPPTIKKSLRAWFSGAIRNLVRLRFRKDQSRMETERLVARESRTSSASDEAGLKEVRRTIVEAVLELEEPYHSAIELRYFGELSASEVANKLNIPVETVRTRLKRGLAKLRQKLDREFSDRSSWCLALAPLAGLKVGAKAATAGVAASTVSTVSGGILMATKVKVGIAAAVVVIGIAISLLVFLTGQEQETIEKLDNSVTSTHSEQNRSEYIGGKLSTKGDGEDREDVKSRISFVDLTGHLLSKSDGSDIANAKVVVSKLPYTPEAGSAQEVTDSTGKFIVKVPLPDSDETSGFHLCFSAKGFSDLKTWVPFNPSREHMELGSYYLEENEEFTLRIIDSEGNPRPNAQVQYFGIEDPKPVWKKKTDTEGYIYFSEQELMSWGQNPLLNYIVLHVSADGFADCFFNKMIRNNESPPKELAIEKSAIWNGIVSVKDTNTPIPNATIRVHPFFDVGEQFVEVMKTTTDESGRFELPLFTFYENPRLYVCVSAAGYCGSMSTPKNSIPTKIELIRATKHITCLVIDEEKQTPLVQLPLIVNDKDTAVTDDSGQFLLTNYGGKRMNLRVTSVDGEMYYRGGYRPDDYSDKKLIIPLKRQIQNKLRMKVEDELGMPIVGAWGRLYLSSDDRSPESDFHTDENGIGIFEFQISNPFDAIVIVDKKGYYTEKPVNVRLGRKQNEDRTEKDIVINIVMKKGTLFQKIRVVNENKNSKKKFQKVVAEIVLEDGTTATINERTDEKGLCEMTFPPFREGILFIHDRPDTIVPIDYGRILENDWIDIYVYDQLDTNNSVSGLVRDEDGTPLEDISFFPVVSDGSDRKISAIRTDSVGKFCLPAFRNEVFKLTIRPLFKNGKFYFASEESGLTAGTSIEVTMKSVPGVKIDLYGLFKNRDYRLHDYDCWLERPDGNRLQVTEYHKFFLSVVFLNVPDGAAKAIVISHSGRQYETEYFDVKAGKTSEEVQLVEN